MLVPKRMSATKSAFMMILIIIIISGIGYLIYTRFIQTEGTVDDSLGIGLLDIKQLPIINTDFSSDFIHQPPYSILVQNGRLPVKASVTGRSNPFAEVPFSLLNR